MILSFGVTPCCLASLTFTGPRLRAGFQVRPAVLRAELDLDVGAVQGDVAADKLHALYAVIAGELPGLFADLAPQLPVLVLFRLVPGRGDAQDLVGGRV